MLLDVWPMWLDVAIDHAVLARDAREKLRAELAADPGMDEDRKGALLVEECTAGMVSICAAAFALDNFFSCIRDCVPGIESLEKEWAAAGTARHKRVSESIRRTFRVSNAGGKALRATVREIFKYRDWAVHPPAELREPIYNELIDAGTEWRFVAYRAFNASGCARTTSAFLSQVLAAPRESNAPLVKWCEGRVDRSKARAERAELLLGEQE
ncbi:hypothetical protein ACWEOW_13420 [Monashia sp. NPDC004114]